MSSKSSLPPPGERFKITLLSLADIMSKELDLARSKNIDVVDKEIINFGIGLIRNSEGNIITEGFIIRSSKYWDRILEKNEAFFTDSNNSSIIFGELSSIIVDGFIKLIKDRLISENLMKSLWQHLYALVKISISYIFLTREPVIKKDIIKYTKKTWEKINLEEEAHKWNIDLIQIV